MAEETTTESVVSEPVAEPAPVQPEPAVVETPSAPDPIPEPIIETTPTPEPVNTNGSNGENGIKEAEPEPVPTAQPVEPLNTEPISEPAPIPEPVEEAQEPVLEAQQEAPQQESNVSTGTPAPAPAPEPQVIASAFLISRARELLIKAREMIQFRKRKKLEKIMSLFLKQSSITNDEVQKLVYVSDATATRYLQQLEQEGKIKKENAGKYLSYSRI